MKRKLKVLSAFISMGLILIGIMITYSIKAEWKQDATGWWYVENNSYKKDSWFQDIDGKWYYFDSNGYMKTGWFQDIDGKWYYFDVDGHMKTDWLKDGAAWYYLNKDGSMKTGWFQDIDGKWYYLESNGALLENIEEKLYYNYINNEILSHMNICDYQSFLLYSDAKFVNVSQNHLGLVSAFIHDINNDNLAEMILVYSQGKEYGGAEIFIEIYKIENGNVKSLKKLEDGIFFSAVGETNVYCTDEYIVIHDVGGGYSFSNRGSDVYIFDNNLQLIKNYSFYRNPAILTYKELKENKEYFEGDEMFYYERKKDEIISTIKSELKSIGLEEFGILLGDPMEMTSSNSLNKYCITKLGYSFDERYYKAYKTFYDYTNLTENLANTK